MYIYFFCPYRNASKHENGNGDEDGNADEDGNSEDIIGKNDNYNLWIQQEPWQQELMVKYGNTLA